MKRNLLIALNVFLFIIFIAEVVLITPLLLKPKKDIVIDKATPIKAVNAPPSPTTPVIILETPPLPTTLSWQSTDPSDENSILNTSKELILSIDNEASVDIKGNEWVSVQEEESSAIAAYQTTLSQEGWKNTAKHNNQTFTTIVADGPTGGMWGYLKIVDDKIRVVIISLRTISKTSSKTTYPCPCNYEYLIFVSEPMSLEEIQNTAKLSSQEEQ